MVVSLNSRLESNKEERKHHARVVGRKRHVLRAIPDVAFRASEFGFESSAFGFRFSVFGFRFSFFGLRVLVYVPVSGFVFSASGFGLRASCFAPYLMQHFELWNSGLGFQLSGFGLRFSAFRFRFSGFGFRLSGFVFIVFHFGLRALCFAPYLM